MLNEDSQNSSLYTVQNLLNFSFMGRHFRITKFRFEISFDLSVLNQPNSNRAYTRDDIFMHDSIYAIVRICHGNSVCLSVRPSVCHTGGSVKSV